MKTVEGVRKCRIAGCKNRRSSKDKSLSTFRVPSDKQQAMTWLQRIGDEELLEVPIRFLQSNVRICEGHFRPSDLRPSEVRKRLLPKVIPTQFPPGHKFLTDKRMLEWTNEKWVSEWFADQHLSPPALPASSSSNCSSNNEESSALYNANLGPTDDVPSHDRETAGCEPPPSTEEFRVLQSIENSSHPESQPSPKSDQPSSAIGALGTSCSSKPPHLRSVAFCPVATVAPCKVACAPAAPSLKHEDEEAVSVEMRVPFNSRQFLDVTGVVSSAPTEGDKLIGLIIQSGSSVRAVPVRSGQVGMGKTSLFPGMLVTQE